MIALHIQNPYLVNNLMIFIYTIEIVLGSIRDTIKSKLLLLGMRQTYFCVLRCDSYYVKINNIHISNIKPIDR